MSTPGNVVQAGISGPQQFITGGPQQVNTGGGASGDLSALLNLGSSLYGLYNSSQTGSKANTVYQQSNPFGGYRPYYGQQLLDLIQNPSSISSQPGYQFLMDQGVTAIDRSAAASGQGVGSGAEKADLTKYGQGLADQFYQQQVQELSGLAGANINPANPFQALQGVGGAASGIGSSLAGLSSSIPGVANFLSKLFGSGTGGTPGVDPNMLGGFTPSTGGDPSAWQTYTDPNNPGDPGGGFPSQTYTDPNNPGDPGAGLDLSGLFSNPKAAGGEAATAAGPSLGQIFNTGGQVAGIASGIASGTPAGYAGAATGAASLVASHPGTFDLTPAESKSLGSYAGIAGDTLGLIQGIRQGGVVGDTSAAFSGIDLATRAGAATGALGTVAGYGAPLLGIYSGIKQGGPIGYGEAALDAYKLYGTVSSALSGSGAAAGGAAAASGGAATGSAAGGAAAGIGSTVAAGAGAAAIFALPILAEFGVIGDDTLPSGAAFVKSVQGTPYFTKAEQQQMNQVYGQVGEAGFWQWFNKNYPGFTGPGTSAIRGSYKPD